MVSASPAISTSLWPTPTVSTSTTSQPAASSTRSACGVAPRQPAEVTARGHRADVDVAVEGVVLHPHPVAEQGAAGERRRRVDRQHADALAGLAQLADQRVGRGGLADARRAGDADDLGVPGVRRQRGHHLAQLRRLRPRPGDQPGDGARRHPRAPGLTSSSTDAGVGVATHAGHADDQGVALAAATAQRGRADAAAAALELEGEVQHDPGAGHADRVAERDGAAVDVDLVLGDARARGPRRCRPRRTPR